VEGDPAADGARARSAGNEPKQPWWPEAGRTRPGSRFAPESTDFEDWLVERFGDACCRIVADDTD